MEKKLKTTRLLVIDTALVILFTTALVLANIYLTNHISNRLKEIDDSREWKLSTILQMTRIARERTSLMLKMYVEEDLWKADEEFLKFYKLRLDFINLREELYKQQLTDAEQRVFNDALSLIKVTEPLQDNIVDRIKSGDLLDVHSDISRKDIPMEIELLGIFEKLTKQVIASSYQSRLAAKREFTTALVAVSVISVVILLMIFFLMNRSLRKIGKIELALIIEAENQSWNATHDPLTNICNRRWLQYKLDGILKQEQASDESHVLIYIDLDDFKLINDRYGHVAGDYFLQQLCRSIEGCIRHSDVFARMGGDEFAILLEYCHLDVAGKIASAVLETVQKLQIEYEGHSLSCHCSIGCYEFTAGDLEFEELIKRADALCYRAKKAGKNRIEQGTSTQIDN